MKNLVFMLWALLFPLMEDIAEYFESRATQLPHEKRTRNQILSLLIIYFFVGWLLYEK